MFVESVVVLDAAVSQIAADHLSSQPVLFRDWADKMHRQIEMAARLSGYFNCLAGNAAAPGIIFATSCSPDGSFLIFQRGDPRRFDLWVLRLSGEHKASPLFDESEVTRTYPQISPDGRRLAYTSDESGREETMCKRSPHLATNGGPRLGEAKSRDGPATASNCFRHGDKMLAVDVQTKSAFKSERAHLLFEGFYAQSDLWTTYDVATDGQRFVMLKEEDEGRANEVLRVVLNWAAELNNPSRRGSN